MNIKHALLAAFTVGSITSAEAAMAQGVDVAVGVGIPLSPGLNATSPGQAFNAARTSNPTTSPSTLSPGQTFIQGGHATPPGQTFTNYGRSKK
jgi:hypothetical protein